VSHQKITIPLKSTNIMSVIYPFYLAIKKLDQLEMQAVFDTIIDEAQFPNG